eukprot:comp23474_c1_seq1/m.39234 comp23474_c1_seq1/g.39234  ORF comp23474_c1_seq1/g.39234 comp23474_c1_seq1/m.39234 type:complete len:630 (-) comp23474_c1_seq1:172-2061(-)
MVNWVVFEGNEVKDVDWDGDGNAGRNNNEVTSLTLSWHNVDFYITQKTGKTTNTKQILKGISGAVKPGEMIALMGTSGAGKTTFLNLLSGRNLGDGRMDGVIRVNGYKRDKSFRRIAGYVEQDDVLMPQLTVKETFYFQARLRLPNSWSDQQKNERAQSIINELGLGHTMGTRIGNHLFKGISGGERKRVAIGCELITNPRILFLDEPTSGLDSFTSYHVMNFVRQLADNGRAVITTIHQPRTTVYDLFDKLLLLSRGEPVYYGPASEAIDWFSQLGYPCAEDDNPADHFLDVTTIDGRSAAMEQETKLRNQKMVEAFRDSKYWKEADKEGAQAKMSPDMRPGRGLERLNALKQFTVLWKRAIKNFLRDRQAVSAEAGQTISLAFLIGGIFFGLNDDQNSILNRAGILFFICLILGFGPSLAAIQLFHGEKAVFLRERSGGVYQVLPYYLSKSVAEFPFQIFFPIFFACVVYWMVDFNNLAERFIFFIVGCICQYFTTQGIGIALSAATPTPDIAAAVAPVIVVFFGLFGGFFLNSKDLWSGFVWIQKISFMYYIWRALMVNEFEGLYFTCDADGSRCQSTGEVVLNNFDFGDTNKYVDLVIVFMMGVFYRFLAYVILRVVGKPKVKIF